MRTTIYFDDFILYYKRAARLQKMNLASETGRDVYTQQVGDPLMDYVTIYDCVERRYAGFSNAIQQIWYGSQNPKRWQIDARFDRQKQWFTELEWLWIFLIHRVTGSGASFSHDHGFRNSILADMAMSGTQAGEMKKFVLQEMQRGRPIFTSIGNQIPPFPKPEFPFRRGSELYISEYAPRLCFDMLDALRGRRDNAVSVQRSADYALDLHRAYGLKQFKFVLTAWVMDIAEYFPEYVDPYSHVHYGKNALESLALMFEGRIKQDDAMEHLIRTLENDGVDREVLRPYSLEDVLCDYVRYLEHYVPKGYGHLEPWQIENMSITGHAVRHASHAKHMETHASVQNH